MKRHASSARGMIARHMTPMTGTAEKPTAATRFCHLPRDSAGANFGDVGL